MPQIARRWINAWPILLLVPLIWVPLPSVLVGHPWKVELVLASILLTFLLAYRSSSDLRLQSFREKAVIVPMAVLILWSCASVCWAASPYSVAHHTLLWTAYL